ncbi:MAG: hypothetical protein ACKOHI_13805, partial [Phycisphaerales bacterium]
MNPGTAAFVASLASSWFMAGLIWVVQVVHYPLFGRVGSEGFAAYESAHARLITPIVGPAMLVELVSSIALLAARPRGMPAWAAWVGVALVRMAVHEVGRPGGHRVAHGDGFVPVREGHATP